MTRILTLTAAVAALSLTSCASTNKECSSCCEKSAKKECCEKAAAANKECAVCKPAKKQ